MTAEWDVHTCHDECPCHTGGEPTPDFLPVESAVPVLGWWGYIEHLARTAEARKAASDEEQQCP